MTGSDGEKKLLAFSTLFIYQLILIKIYIFTTLYKNEDNLNIILK